MSKYTFEQKKAEINKIMSGPLIKNECVQFMKTLDKSEKELNGQICDHLLQAAQGFKG